MIHFCMIMMKMNLTMPNGVSSSEAPPYQPQDHPIDHKNYIYANQMSRTLTRNNHPKIILTSSHPNINFIKPIVIPLCKTQWFFILLISLMVLSIFNLAITFWIIRLLHLSSVRTNINLFIIA